MADWQLFATSQRVKSVVASLAATDFDRRPCCNLCKTLLHFLQPLSDGHVFVTRGLSAVASSLGVEL